MESSLKDGPLGDPMSPRIRPQLPSLNLDLIPSATRELMERLAHEAGAAGVPLYLAGGVVRDLLLKKPIQDLDLVVEGNAIRFVRSLVKKHGGKATTHPRFGTATWQLPLEWTGHGMTQNSMDLASARAERYEFPGALPIVEFSHIHEDLKRRDFTINAMAYRLGEASPGELLDPFGGRDDLQRRLVRVLHTRSFLDDPTRMFRAIRYARRYGFEIAQTNRRLFSGKAVQVLSTLSGERLRHELDLILDEGEAASMLQDAAELHLLENIHPALRPPGENFGQLLASIPDPRLEIVPDRRALGYLLWLADQPPADLAEIIERLAFTAGMGKFLSGAAGLLTDLPALQGASPSQWTARLDKTPPFAIYAMYLRTEEPALASYLVRWRTIHPRTNGNDLVRLKVAPGPAFKKILWRLRSAWLDGEISTHEDELSLLNSLLYG